MDPVLPDHDDFFGPVPPERPRRRGLRTAGVAAATVFVVGATTGAVAFNSYLSGGGTQPEDLLSSGAFAYAKVDLDPAADQKLALYQLSRKFPDVLRDQGKDAVLKDTVLAAMLADENGVSYDKDIKPWLGDRAGVAVYPAAAKNAAPRIAAAVQFTDVQKMTDALTKIAKTEHIGWAIREDYVVISTDKIQAEDLLAADADAALARQADYAADVASLGGDQVAVSWLDFGGYFKALVGTFPLGAPDLTQQLQAGVAKTGRFVMGLHASAEYLEMTGRGPGWPAAAASPGSNLAGRMPADSVGVLSIAGLGPEFSKSWQQTVAARPEVAPFLGMAAQYGLQLPGDIAAVFGTESAAALAASADEQPLVSMLSRGGDAARAKQLAGIVTGLTGQQIVTRKTTDGFVAGNDAAFVDATAAGSRALGDSASYKLAVPEADQAQIVLYVDLDKAIAIAEMTPAEAQEAKKAKALDAFGLTVGGGEGNAFRIRLTVD